MHRSQLYVILCSPVIWTALEDVSLVMESRNIALQGTLCTNGNGLGVCVGLGENTVFAHIAKESTGNKPNKTALEIEILRFVLIIFGLALSVVILVVGAA